MSNCKKHAELHAALDKALDRIPSSFDRIEEAHHWLHVMERDYHMADPFRWALAAYIKALKEVPQLLSMELQNANGFTEWYRPHRKAVEANVLLRSFSKMRDGIVHKSMLLPSSECWVGITKFRGLKLGLKLSSDPKLNSELVMRHYLYATRNKDDIMGVLSEDEDTMPCVNRIWRFSEFPDDEVIALCSKAWLLMNQLIEKVVIWLGATPPPRKLNCLKAIRQYNLRFLT